MRSRDCSCCDSSRLVTRLIHSRFAAISASLLLSLTLKLSIFALKSGEVSVFDCITLIMKGTLPPPPSAGLPVPPGSLTADIRRMSAAFLQSEVPSAMLSRVLPPQSSRVRDFYPVWIDVDCDGLAHVAGSVFSVDDCVRNGLTQDLFGNLQLVFSASSLYDGYPLRFFAVAATASSMISPSSPSHTVLSIHAARSS